MMMSRGEESIEVEGKRGMTATTATTRMDEELDEDARDHAGVTHGCTMLSYGDMNRMSTKLYTIRPKVGDFYIFPAWLSHMVYPFRAAGERRSFSINFSYARKK